MTLSVVLGAGFSKAIDPSFPTADELGDRVRELAPEAMTSAPPTFRGGLFERWLSRIAEPQPDLSEAANLQNARDFQIVTETIHRVMLSLEDQVHRKPIPWWLMRLLGLLHLAQANVVTFNYDTLVESAAARTFDHEQSMVLSHYSLTVGVPPTPPEAGMYGPSLLNTFRLLKLHGSVDTYWVPGDSSGATITRVADAYWARGKGMNDPELNLERRAPGRVPFIVPPASAKSALFANPITRQLWRTAASRLAESTDIVVMGYSAPLTDIVASAMLADAQRAKGARIAVVNPYPEPVMLSLTQGAALPEESVFPAAPSCVAYVDAEERRVAREAAAAFRSQVNFEAPVAVSGGFGVVHPASDLSVDGTEVLLRLGDQTTRGGGIDTSAWLTAGQILAAMDRAGADRLAVEVAGERAQLIKHYLFHFSDRASAVLVRSAVRPPPLE